MTFRDQALEAYAKHSKDQAEWDARRAAEFAEQATERLAPDFPFRVADPDTATLKIEDEDYYKVKIEREVRNDPPDFKGMEVLVNTGHIDSLEGTPCPAIESGGAED